MMLPTAFNIIVLLILMNSCFISADAHGTDKSTNNTVSYTPRAEWLYGYGTDNGDHVFEGFQTADGGYIAIGKTSGESSRFADMLVVKIDAKGKLQWQRIIGNKRTHEEGRCIVEVADGYIAGGVLSQSGKTKAGLLKLNRKGKIVWTKIFSHAGYGAIRGIDITTDGGIVATGYTHNKERDVPFIADEAKGFIMKTDANGVLLWKRELPVTQGTKIRTDKHNGGFVICSTVWNFSKGKDHQDACLIKTDSKGNVKWIKSYGGAGNDQCFDFDLTAEHGYVLAGHTTSYGNGGWDVWLVRVDRKGDLIWQKSFGQPLGGNPKHVYDECYGVKTTKDGGFIMACGSGIESDRKVKKSPLNTWAAYVIRTDSTGKLLWQYIYHTPGQGHNAAEYVSLCDDGGYILFLDSDTAGKMETGNFGFLKLTREK